MQVCVHLVSTNLQRETRCRREQVYKNRESSVYQLNWQALEKEKEYQQEKEADSQTSFGKDKERMNSTGITTKECLLLLLSVM